MLNVNLESGGLIDKRFGCYNPHGEAASCASTKGVGSLWPLLYFAHFTKIGGVA